MNRSELLFDAPSAYWRALGSVTEAVLNKTDTLPAFIPGSETSMLVWSDAWMDEEADENFLLTLTESAESPGNGVADLSHGSFNDGIAVVNNFHFDVLPHTQERQHVLGVVKVVLDATPNLPDPNEISIQFKLQKDAGMLRANLEDAQELYRHVLLAPFMKDDFSA